LDARYVRETGEVHTRFLWGDMMERGHLEFLDIDGRILKFIFKKWNGGLCNGLIYLKRGTCVRLLRMR